MPADTCDMKDREESRPTAAALHAFGGVALSGAGGYVLSEGSAGLALAVLAAGGYLVVAGAVARGVELARG